jgi:hypothetical protein
VGDSTEVPIVFKASAEAEEEVGAEAGRAKIILEYVFVLFVVLPPPPPFFLLL